MRVSQRGNTELCKVPRNHRLKGWDLTETGDQLNHRMPSTGCLPPARTERGAPRSVMSWSDLLALN